MSQDDPFLQMVDKIQRTQYEASQRSVLQMWTVYDHPANHPTGFVARKFEISNGAVVATEDAFGTVDSSATGLLFMREIFIRAGLHCVPRHDNDDPTIVEAWM
ncbi:hypothetical protein [Bradyrhizobium sp. USDA 10063]